MHMKILFEKPALFIKYALTIMVLALLLGTVFVVGFGFNTSSEFGGVYELTVDCFDENKIGEYTDECKSVLAEYGYSAEDVIVEKRNVCDTIVVRYASNSLSNAQKIEADVTTKLELNENLVSIAKLSHASLSADALKMLIAFGVSVIAVFAYLLIRMGWKRAVTIILNFVLSAFLSLAIFAISRVELSFVGIGMIMLIAGLSTILLVMILSKLEVVKQSQEKEESLLTNYLSFIETNKYKAIIPSALLLLVFVCLMFTFVRSLVFIGLVGLITSVISAFNLIIFSTNFLLLLDAPKKKRVKK